MSANPQPAPNSGFKFLQQQIQSAERQVRTALSVAQEYGISGYRDLELIEAELRGLAYRASREQTS